MKYNLALNISDNLNNEDLEIIKQFINKLNIVRINLDLIKSNRQHPMIFDNFLRHIISGENINFVSRNPIRIFYKDEAELYLTNNINFEEIPEKIITKLGSFGMSRDITEENIDKFISICTKYYPDIINKLYSFKQDIVTDSYLIIDDNLNLRLCGFDLNLNNSLLIMNIKTKEIYNDFIWNLNKDDCYSYERCSECGNLYCHATPYINDIITDTQQISPLLCDKYKYLENKIKEYCSLTYLNTLSKLISVIGK